MHASRKAGAMSHWGECITTPQQVFPYAFRAGPLLARAHTIEHPRIPDGALFTYIGPHTFLEQFSKFLWSPIRSANLSCAPASRCSLHGCPTSRG